MVCKQDLLGLLINHLRIQDREHLFICNETICRLTVGEELQAMSLDYLQKFSIRSQSDHFHVQREEMTREDTQYHKVRRTSVIYKNINARTSTVPHTTARMCPDLNPIPVDESMQEIFQGMSRFSEQEVNEEIQRYENQDSVSTQISKLIEGNKLSELEKEINIAAGKIADKLIDIQNNPTLEPSPCDSHMDMETSDDNDTPIYVSSMSSSCDTTSSHPRPISHTVPINQAGNLEEKDNWEDIANQIIQKSYTNPINYTTLSSIISKFPQRKINLASEIYSYLEKNKKAPISAEKFLSQNKVKIIYSYVAKETREKLAKSSILIEDPSYEDLAIMNNDEPDCLSPYEKSQPFQGINSQVITQEIIPDNLLGMYSAIIVGHSELYRNCYIPLHSYSYDEFLNMSSPVALTYTAIADGPKNTLYSHLMQVIKQLGKPRRFPPIMVEFFHLPFMVQSIEELHEQTALFIQTLKKVQENYSGMIIGISPPPFWHLGTNLSTYLTTKYMIRKGAEFLTALGIANGIYVTSPFVSTLPLINQDNRELSGYLMDYSFKRRPLFDKNGQFTIEAYKRGYKSLRSDLRLIRSLNLN